MPLIPKISGINNTDNVWKIKVLQVDEIAEIKPLFKAVKNDEVNTFKPYKMKENAYILMARVVKLTKSIL